MVRQISGRTLRDKEEEDGGDSQSSSNGLHSNSISPFRSKAVILLFFPLFVAVPIVCVCMCVCVCLCVWGGGGRGVRSLYYAVILCVISSFAINYPRKRELVA